MYKNFNAHTLFSTMIYPPNFENKIDFDQIRSLVKGYCVSSLGKEKVDNVIFHSDSNDIIYLQEQTEEFRQILLFESTFPSQDYLDLRVELTRLKIEGTYIEIESLCELKSVLKTIQDCLLFFRIKKEEEKYPYLQQLCEGITVDNALIKTIESLVDDKGNIRDNASSDLHTVRQKIHGIENELQKQLRKIVNQAKKDELIEANAEVTIREGRLVIPVPAVYKRRLKGFIHDESATGQTVYIEPQEIFESNNTLRDLKSLEKREIIRILSNFTNELRPSIPSINSSFEFLSQIDFIRAKAKFALSINAIKPIMVEKPSICWKKAKHPLLYLNFLRQQKEVVPLTIEMDEAHRILIISGPNAGGKSVCLKTVGLLQYMYQCGLLVPVSELSEFGVFNKLFLDIGDEQSIENDLSTYSSHLKNMDAVLKDADKRSLFLMDELGSGTDPQYGGAIAESLLELLSQRRAFGVVTTHFGNLKAMATQTDGIENAAMLFDEEAMKPLFVLKTGKWGSSFTFEIARKIGFSEDLLTHAVAKIGTAQIDYEFLLQKLEREKNDIESKSRMVEAVDLQLNELIEKYNNLNNSIQSQKYEILKTAKNEAKSILENANKIIEKAVREIKESNAEKEVVKRIKNEIKSFDETLTKIIPPAPKELSKKQTLPPVYSKIKLWDYVIVNDTNTVGQVTAINEDEIVVSFNSINFKTTLDKVSKTNNIPKMSKLSSSQIGGRNMYAEINDKSANFKLELDLRGMRVEEATDALERYIDDAVLLHVHEVKILHGKGNGILRSITRALLSKNKDVDDFHDEQLEWGGYGKTVVKIK